MIAKPGNMNADCRGAEIAPEDGERAPIAEDHFIFRLQLHKLAAAHTKTSRFVIPGDCTECNAVLRAK